MNEEHRTVEDYTQASVVANLPKEEKALFGFATYTQAMIVACGIVLGFLGFLLAKFILGFFATFLMKWMFSFIIWILIVIPFAILAFKPVRSDNDGNSSVVLYPLYKKMMIDRHVNEERGIYLNYHYNHPIINREHAVHIENETTNYDK